MKNYWKSIKSAPQNGHKILLRDDADGVWIGYWDAYYAEGGRGYTGGSGWINGCCQEINPIQWHFIPPFQKAKE